MTRPKVVERIAELRSLLDEARARNRRIGFVPTMGFLHEGHASLMRRAREENDIVLVSIFVNPLQFGPSEDFDAYPRDLEKDLDLCEAADVDLVFHPPVEEMYREPTTLTVTVGAIGDILEGKTRPGHFDGVATVVTKLFNIAGACRAYFGEKDAQQLVVIRRLARQLDFPVEVIGCPTVREADGLAMSSRNTYLNGEDRVAAAVLKRALDEGVRLIGAGHGSADAISQAMARVIGEEPLAKLDYTACVDPDTLAEPAEVGGPVLLAVAAWVGNARLIDNVTVSPAPDAGARTGTPKAGASIRKG
ncbi:MAG: pantoate--beta-alanine ligase [Actinomycetota bacterium]